MTIYNVVRKLESIGSVKNDQHLFIDETCDLENVQEMVLRAVGNAIQFALKAHLRQQGSLKMIGFGTIPFHRDPSSSNVH